jgi:hypothetical protein
MITVRITLNIAPWSDIPSRILPCQTLITTMRHNTSFGLIQTIIFIRRQKKDLLEIIRKVFFIEDYAETLDQA